VNANGTGVADGFATGVAESRPSLPTEYVDQAPAGLGRHEQLAPVRREADLAGRGQEVRRVRVGQAQRPRRARDRRDAVPADAESLNDPRAARVEHVGQVAVHADAGGELPAGRLDVDEPQAVAVRAEGRDRVAAGVHRDQQTVPAVVGQRPLRREPVGLRPGRRDPTEAAGRVRAGANQAAVVPAVVDGDPVAVELVRLHEDDTLAVSVVARVPAAGGRRLRSDEREHDHGEQRDQGWAIPHVPSFWWRRPR
jgi:hypothetical protein